MTGAHLHDPTRPVSSQQEEQTVIEVVVSNLPTWFGLELASKILEIKREQDGKIMPSVVRFCGLNGGTGAVSVRGLATVIPGKQEKLFRDERGSEQAAIQSLRLGPLDWNHCG
jgi:hypothetical protein